MSDVKIMDDPDGGPFLMHQPIKVGGQSDDTQHVVDLYSPGRVESRPKLNCAQDNEL